MSRVRRLLAVIDRVASRTLSFSRNVLFWPAVYAVAAAAAAWPLLHEERMADWARNEVSSAERIQQLNYLLIALAVMALLLLGYLGLGRLRRGEWQLETRAGRFNRFFAFALALPFLAALNQSAVESKRPIHTLFFIGAATICLMPTVATLWEATARRRAGRAGESSAWRLRLRAITVLVFVGGLFVAYGLWFSHLSINNHHALQTRIFDLAIYDNIFYQSSHGNPLGCTFSSTGSHVNGHFDAILVLLSPLYLLYPRAESILVLQSFWCAAGVVPAYLLGRRYLDSRFAGAVIAAAWVLYPAMHGANLYEFHSLTLLATPMLWLMYLLTAGHLRVYFLLLPFMLLIREDVSLLLCGVGLAAMLTGDKRLLRAGWITIAIAGIYFIVIKAFIMSGVEPAAGLAKVDPLGGKQGFAWYYTDMIPKNGGLTDLLSSLLTNPAFVIDFALQEPKVIFLLQLFLPLAFLPLFASRWRFAAVFGLFYILLASRKYVYSIHFQYSVILFPVLFALAPMGLRRLRDSGVPKRLGLAPAQFVSVMLVCVLVSSALTSWKFGGAVSNSSFRGGFVRIPHALSEAQQEKYRNFRALIEQIPPDASVTAIGRAAPHVSNRAEAWRFKHEKPSDYLLGDTGKLTGPTRREYDRRIAEGEVELLGKTGPFELYRVVK